LPIGLEALTGRRETLREIIGFGLTVLIDLPEIASFEGWIYVFWASGLH